MTNTQDKVRPPFTLRLSVVDADGKLIQSIDGPTVEMGKFESLKSYGRAVGMLPMLHDLLKRSFLAFTVRQTPDKIERLVGEVAYCLNHIDGEPADVGRN